MIREAARLGQGQGNAWGPGCIRSLAPTHLSLAAARRRPGIPVTGYVSIGSDIIHSLPSCDGAALGQTSYTDFLIFAESLQKLEGEVFLNIGSAVTGRRRFSRRSRW